MAASGPASGAYMGSNAAAEEKKRNPGEEATPLLSASASLPTMKRNTSSAMFDCAQFHEDRTWSGFSSTTP